jgi:RHS repeat-associated protein
LVRQLILFHLSPKILCACFFISGNTTIDAHGKRTITYKDKEGKILLSKVEIKNDGEAVITSYDGWLNTLYIYDDMNKLRYTITPKAVEWLITNAWVPPSIDILKELCYRYEYDDKGRLIITKAPGAAEVCTVYDAKDRSVLFQDGNLLASGKWQYTLYDDQDRIKQTGLWTNAQNREYHQQQAENSVSYPTLVGIYEILTESYYDNYNWISSCNCGLPATLDASQLQGNWLNSAAADQFPYPLTIKTTQQVVNLVTGTKTKVLNSNPAQYLYAVSFFDDYGNTIQLNGTNQTGGVDVLTTQYSYDGKILAIRQKHTKAGNNSQTHNVYSRFEFDNAGRILKNYKRIDNDPEKLLSNNIYNEQSQLIKVELGKLPNNTPVTTIDYAYNLNGSLKSMNESFVKGFTNDRFFGQILNKDFGFTQSQYNGNIAGVQWRSIGDGERRALGYSYDPANRVLKSDFTQFTGGWNNSANIDFSTKLGDGSNPATAYDANGNIKSMAQKGLQLYQSDIVDNLTYRYADNNYSNKLWAVDEAAATGTSANATENILGDFKNNKLDAPDNDYTYDANGNSLSDNNKSITSITYNHLNKPIQVQIDGKGTIKYVYGASGEKLQKIVQPLMGQSITYTYVGNFVYKNDVLQIVYTEEGRIRPVINGQQTTFYYDYFIKDYLGNVRMVVTDEQRTDMYPSATLEDANIANEQLYYDRANIGLIARPAAFGTAATNGGKVQLLQKNTQSLGVNKLLKVMSKDKINVQVDYFFPAQAANNATANGLNSLTSILSTFLNSVNAPAALKGNGAGITQQLNGSTPLNTLLTPQNANVPGTLPKAYLNILFFDEQFRFVSQSSKIVAVTVADSRQQIIQTNIEAPKNGYIYVYVNNESNNLVYFDNFQVSQVRGPIVEENHYYPFGSKMTAICSKALPNVQNSLGYQFKELDEEFDIDWYDFEARSYDPQIGRFLQQDPADQFASGYTGMGNNWVISVDPDGRFAWFVPIIIGAAVGAYMGGVMANDGAYNPAKWDFNNGKTWKYMAGGALVGGVSAGIGASIASAGGFMANTMGIVASSFINSVGTAVYTGGQTDVGVSFGMGSYSFDKGICKRNMELGKPKYDGENWIYLWRIGKFAGYSGRS